MKFLPPIRERQITGDMMLTDQGGAGGPVSQIEIYQTSVTVAAGSITETELADGSVTTPKLADVAVTTPKIADVAVTSAKIALGAINGLLLAIGVVTDAHLDSDAKVGSLASLITTYKANVVGAINEIKSQISSMITGTGTSGRLSRWLTSTTQGDSLIRDTGSRAGIAATLSALWHIHVSGGTDTDTAIRADNAGSGHGVHSVAASGDGVRTESNGVAMRAVANGNDKAIDASRNVAGATTPVSEIGQLNGSNGQDTEKLRQDGSGNVLVMEHNGGGIATTTARNFFIARQGTTRRARLDNTGRFFGQGYQAGGADYAELREVQGGNPVFVAPGDVLVISTSEAKRVAKSTSAADKKVIGIYSTDPGFVSVDSDVDASAAVPVAFAGIVPCKVTDEDGAIAIGDFLVSSSTPGRAKLAPSTPTFGTVIGQALEAHASGFGVIKVRVMRA